MPRALVTVDACVWPAGVMAAWALAWASVWLVSAATGAPVFGVLAGCGVSLLLARRAATRMRRLIVATGFPASLAVLAIAGHAPAWAWLVPLGALLLAYPVRAWSDAPVFPTAADALSGLRPALNLPSSARVLDAGSGLGHGLRALRREWPEARLTGIERSVVLAVASRLWRPRDGVRCADMWATSWSDADMVYLFQRPESMARAWRKACEELPAGGWLVSLAFPVPGVTPDITQERPGARPVFAYRVVPVAAAAGQGRDGRRAARRPIPSPVAPAIPATPR